MEKEKAGSLKFEIDTIELDSAMEKANRLVKLLREAKQIIDSLSGPNKIDSKLYVPYCEANNIIQETFGRR